MGRTKLEVRSQNKESAMAKILIGYWTKTGTTEAYAGALAQALSKLGHTAICKPLAGLGSFDGYDAVALGGPINGMRPAPELSAFIAANAAALAGKATALFTVSYMHGQASKRWNSAIEKGSAAAAAAMGARASTILPGRIAVRLPGLMHFIFGVPKGLPLDRFDPKAMEAWAGRLAALFS
jgi:menaquinone-dependent protoporphyrinogen oxidase